MKVKNTSEFREKYQGFEGFVKRIKDNRQKCLAQCLENTGVQQHTAVFNLVKVKSLSHARLLQPRGLWPTRLLSVHGIHQARILEWVAISFSRGSTLWTVAYQAPLCPWDSSGKNTGVGCHFLLPGIFPTQGLNPDPPLCRQTL